MREEVAHRQLARDRRIFELEPWQVGGDRRVPRDFLLVDEHADERGCHRLGRRADGEERVRVDEVRLSELAHAVAVGEHELIVLHDRDREPRNSPVLYRFGDERIEAGERLALGRDERDDKYRRRTGQRSHGA